MKFKKLVTVIVATFALCLLMNTTCEAAATTKATTKEASFEKQAEKNTKNNSAENFNKRKYTKSELRYMTSIIYCEARGESYAGQKAVGIVVMNRVRSKKFPKTVKKVIYQSGQFSPARNGSLNRALSTYDKYAKKGKFKGEMKSCKEAAIEVLEGSTTIHVHGKTKEMKKYLFFSQRVSGAKYTLGGHQFK